MTTLFQNVGYIPSNARIHAIMPSVKVITFTSITYFVRENSVNLYRSLFTAVLV